MAAAEAAPLVKVGGLGDVVGSLPIALKNLGVEVSIVLPFYGLIDTKKYRPKLIYKNLYKINFSGLDIYLIKSPLFKSTKVYLGKRKYLKNGKYTRGTRDIERFTFFSKAVVKAVKDGYIKTDIIHCHDWHTALIPSFIDEDNLDTKTLFTIHNLANQGIADLDILDYAGLHHDITPALMEDYYDRDGGKIDLMKVGILSADKITTVSPNYAYEILTKEYGEDLESYLIRRQKDLSGILNGLDIDFFDPSHDKLIYKKYSKNNFMACKAANKKYLQAISQLPNKDVPLFGLVTRLVKQKGLDILLPALDKILKTEDLQVVALGTGHKDYENGLASLAKKYPEKLKANITFDIKLAQQIYAGSDFFLMPSSFEPCGLGQMIAMRYGTVPIVRQTGGLKDTVKHNLTGLVFTKYNTLEMTKILQSALKLYKNKAKIKKMVNRDMNQDFSWDKSAKEYLNLYKKLL